MTQDLEAIRAALLRRSLADARRRGVLAAGLQLGGTDLLALEHLMAAGRLSVRDLQLRLGLSSGGATSLIQRLERSGHVTRAPHPRDRRSTLLAVTPSTHRAVAAATAPRTQELDGVAGALAPDERAAVARYLTRIAEVEERELEALAGRGDVTVDDLVAPPRWG